jgi:predicted alpha/beta-hydrolase family hydrolase
MITAELRVQISEDLDVSGVLERPDSCRPGVTPGLILAHGANNTLAYPLLSFLSRRLAETGTASVMRFNFPYAERGASSPNAGSVLMETYRKAHDALVDDGLCPPGPVFLGGKSMGGRIAAESVSRHHEGEGLVAAGLVFLGYPLHAPDNKAKLRTGPLRRIDVPSLFVQGSRDPFCDLELLRPVVEGLDRPGELYVVEGGGHSYEVPKAAGLSPEEIYTDIAARVARFISAHA